MAQREFTKPTPSLAPLPMLEEEDNAPEHRQFPRVRLAVPCQLWIGEGRERSFSASLRSINLSVSGVFLQSTFFLPLGTNVLVSFKLDEEAAPVRARAEIIREYRPPGDDEDAQTGMGARFVEFFGQTEVTLARLFLGPTLQQFAETYLGSERARGLPNELDRVVDSLAAWELQKVTVPADPWRSLAGIIPEATPLSTGSPPPRRSLR